MLFTNDVELACKASIAEVDRIVIDLESRGKFERQQGYHLELNRHMKEDISRIKSTVPISVMCRLNPLYSGSYQEIDYAISAGADTLMLPMFKTSVEVEKFLGYTNKRVRTSLLFETKEAVEGIDNFTHLQPDEVYVGLNDLKLSYGVAFQYQLLAEGKVDCIRKHFPGTGFGFGGITVLDKGKPLATRNILKELARLNSTQVIIRRAFKRDIENRDLIFEVNRIKRFYTEALMRTPSCIEAEHKSIMGIIQEISFDSTPIGSA